MIYPHVKHCYEMDPKLEITLVVLFTFGRTGRVDKMKTKCLSKEFYFLFEMFCRYHQIKQKNK